ncbi:MAG: T9SS type A sorting domain-containing protein, partial [Bacteroidetes bacterium]|nr:T9SS type A sorting domain-containing protein [Bacteroidota bacterium]MBT7143522.1 T9SS type A sorting domain-containing protein [Bacteroidota bacterium]MBT7492922.1 T9SS type A sorting domain-containing protein [Bacteroidota bacterium]
SLEQNYPNPFSPYTWISYTLPEDCTVSLKIFDIRGQLIKDLQNDKKPAGKYSVMWNGTNNSGKRVSSGVYLYQIQTEKFTKTMKLFILN